MFNMNTLLKNMIHDVVNAALATHIQEIHLLHYTEGTLTWGSITPVLSSLHRPHLLYLPHSLPGHYPPKNAGNFPSVP